MNYFICLLFLTSLSVLSLIILGLLRILDKAQATSIQKIRIIKIGLFIIGLSPLICGVLREFYSEVMQVTMPIKFIGQSIAETKYAVSMDTNINWPYYLFILYGAGFFLMCSKIIFSYLSARRLLLSSLPTRIQDQPVFLNNNISSPLSFGFPKAQIFLPSFAEEKWTSREIEMSLTHEKIHLKQNDPLWKLYSLIIRALLFFAPWSYFLHKRFELEMEVYCDEKTCVSTSADIIEYGNLLLTMVCTKEPCLIFTNMTDSTLKRRFLAMKSKTIKRSFLTSLLSFFLLLIGTAAIATTSGIIEKKTSFDTLSKIYVNGKLISSPRIVSRTNQKASIWISDQMSTKGNKISMSGHSLKIELIARDIATSGNGAIGIDYDIQYQNGKEKIHSKPQIIIIPNNEKVINISQDGHAYMRVLVKREGD